jgi:phospholipid/cholesterol/gamma-HCH transport system substrate-binding protein
MRRNVIETVMGAVVLVVAGLFVYFAYSTTEIRSAPGYEVAAKFFRIGGLSNGSDVRISGVKVGTVVDRRLDPTTRWPASPARALSVESTSGWNRESRRRRLPPAA